ncbi:MAG TPA: DUF4332 domain-containing protein [Anaerolineales bacterium]|nr:DUF4332 domain-containing protein [Anaerolineales bacterium]
MYVSMLLEESGPNTELAWLLYFVLGFFLLMVIVGWWVSRQNGTRVEVPQEMHVLHHETSAAPDDLVSLEGIGPKVARILNDAGITTFAALADAKADEIQKILSASGLQMMNPEGWIEQARLAASGDQAGLQKLQSELKGGRRK